MRYSVIVPVFNRPEEVNELLASLCRQTLKDFEVIIVEDGSDVESRDVCRRYGDRLDIIYYAKENGGPGLARNTGAEHASGEYLIILDSDVVLPEGYLQAVDDELRRQPADAFGGPDAAHPDFTPVQKAISYSMTSFFTTGGIRGGKKKLDKFYPRSFNMGIRREVYRSLGGFSQMRFGEDIDFSYRICEAGYSTRLFPEAWVWHKRRTDFRKFYRQVYNSGIARINLEKRHPGTMKAVHLLPAVFTVGTLALVFLSAVGFVAGVCWLMLLPWVPIVLYALIIFADSALKSRSLRVGLLSVPAAFVQLMGYGMGFIKAWWKRCVKKGDEFAAFERNFYK
ncbi:MAG: glycosyltransferase [Prevotella sp.]|nr:glycosyltransferase [Prevotella sp.]